MLQCWAVVKYPVLCKLTFDVVKFTVCHSLSFLVCDPPRLAEEPTSVHRVVQDRLTELLRILRAIIAKHPTLNSNHILSATGNLIAKVKGQNLSCPPLYSLC